MTEQTTGMKFNANMITTITRQKNEWKQRHANLLLRYRRASTMLHLAKGYLTQAEWTHVKEHAQAIEEQWVDEQVEAYKERQAFERDELGY